MSIRIEGADGAVLQKIDTTMMSTEDQSILPDRPLVVGPLYTPNPELAGQPDGKLPASRSRLLEAARAGRQGVGMFVRRHAVNRFRPDRESPHSSQRLPGAVDFV